MTGWTIKASVFFLEVHFFINSKILLLSRNFRRTNALKTKCVNYYCRKLCARLFNILGRKFPNSSLLLIFTAGKHIGSNLYPHIYNLRGLCNSTMYYVRNWLGIIGNSKTEIVCLIRGGRLPFVSISACIQLRLLEVYLAL